MKLKHLALFLLICFFVGRTKTFCQNLIPQFSMIGLNGQKMVLNEDSLKNYPNTEVKRKDKDGKNHTYSGVLVSILLKKLNVPQGANLRGKSLIQYLLIKAKDDYEVIFALPELDSDFTNSLVILADRVDGNPFPETEGPFRIIVEKDKKPARCVRQVRELRILNSQ